MRLSTTVGVRFRRPRRPADGRRTGLVCDRRAAVTERRSTVATPYGVSEVFWVRLGRVGDQASSSSTSPPPPVVRIVCLPGNPGCGGYYIEFAALLLHALAARGAAAPGSAAALASLAGHAASADLARAGKQPDGLDALAHQERHLAASLPQLLSDIGVVPLFDDDYPPSTSRPEAVLLLGHSIGARIALASLALTQQWREGERDGGVARVSVDAVGLMMPFLASTHASAEQTTVRRATGRPRIFALMGRLLSWLPRWLSRLWLVRLLRHTPRSADTTHGLLAAGQAGASARLACAEFADLDEAPDWTGWSQACGTADVFALSVPVDGWRAGVSVVGSVRAQALSLREPRPRPQFPVPPFPPLPRDTAEQRARMDAANFPTGGRVVVPHASHGFCVRTEETQVVADAIAERVAACMIAAAAAARRVAS